MLKKLEKYTSRVVPGCTQKTEKTRQIPGKIKRPLGKLRDKSIILMVLPGKVKIFRVLSGKSKWGRGDLNPYASRHMILSQECHFSRRSYLPNAPILYQEST